ncbi:putative Transmembrane protein [Quillaja saponaria]|uniref:Transmembrane protein n=1 Tax=Quillaja saponaria TaxID=32244 RepID=A0AAD7KND8_QUISA|nr:putative Transmembrane protein [Quillaja saponaria]
MALPSNKPSSSSSPASSRPNPNSRNSEINNPIRRSFTGNPFKTPSVVANGSVGLVRRNSVGGRDSVPSWGDHDDKENGREQTLKPARVQSPAASKGTKNFMSPTISASSKVTMSPRKKILQERNEPAGTVSSSESKGPFRKVTFADVAEEIDSKGEISLKEKKVEAQLNLVSKEASLTASLISEDLNSETLDLKVPVNSKPQPDLLIKTLIEEPDSVNLDQTFKISLTPPPKPSTTLAPLDAVPLSSKTQPDLLIKTVIEEPDSVNLDQTFKISLTPPPKPSTTLAPLDADPLMPPYDPQTNYISPRPQFLCYRPHPQTQSEGSQTEAEDVSSSEVVKEEGNVTEPSPTGSVIPKEPFEAKGSSKPYFFTRLKLVAALFLVLSITCLSASFKNSAVVDPTAFKDLSTFYKMYESSHLQQFAKVKFDGLARNFQLWYANSMSSISELMTRFRGVRELVHLPHYNVTAVYNDIPADGFTVYDYSDKGIAPPPQLDLSEVNIVEDEATEYEIDADIADASAYHDVLVPDKAEKVSEDYKAREFETQEDIEDASRGYYKTTIEEVPQDIIVNDKAENVSEEYTASESEEVLEGQLASIIKPHSSDLEQDLEQDEINNLSVLEVQQAQENVHLADDVIVEERSNRDLSDQPVLNSEASETLTKMLGDGKNPVESSDIEMKISEGKTISSDATPLENKQNPRAVDIPPHMLAIVLLVMPLTAAAVFNYARKDRSRSRKNASSVEQQFEKKLDFKRPTEQHHFLDMQLSRNWTSVVDVVGESCPSEVSSLQKCSSYRKGVKGSNEDQSLENKSNKNHRRESLASSADYSMSSPSYGSFTTYEKITSKHGHWDEEVVTPVRRSSRIRKQVTSPS